jgi:hypothetical protein
MFQNGQHRNHVELLTVRERLREKSTDERGIFERTGLCLRIYPHPILEIRENCEERSVGGADIQYGLRGIYEWFHLLDPQALDESIDYCHASNLHRSQAGLSDDIVQRPLLLAAGELLSLRENLLPDPHVVSA